MIDLFNICGAIARVSQYLILFAVAIWWSGSLAMGTEWAMPVAIIATFAAWFVTLPIRRSILRLLSRLLIRSGITSLVCCGVWLQLSRSQKSRGKISACADQEMLCNIYCDVDSRRQAKIVAAVRRVEQAPWSPVSREAMEFLETIRA